MTDDGVSLTNIRHPPQENLIEAVCRAMCLVDKVDPDQRGVGIGALIPVGQEYAMWEARRTYAIAAIYAVWDAEPLPADIDESAVETIEIKIR